MRSRAREYPGLELKRLLLFNRVCKSPSKFHISFNENTRERVHEGDNGARVRFTRTDNTFTLRWRCVQLTYVNERQEHMCACVLVCLLYVYNSS